MENKLGRKSMQDWQAMTDALTARVYKSGFNAGYDAAKDETPDVETMAQLITDRYDNEELSKMVELLERVISHDSKPSFQTVKRVAKVGERILITNARLPGNHYKNGDILKVRAFDYDDDILVEGFDLQIEHEEYEVVIENEGVLSAKSPNQQRAELIQRAREFVEVKENALQYSPDVEGGYKVKRRENPNLCHLITKVKFIVNKEKRTVAALIKGRKGNEIFSKGIAKCMPDEVFHADIGKAIALARALEIDVPVEFMQAVQPDEKAPGMLVEFNSRKVELMPNKYRYVCDWAEGTARIGSIVSNNSIILDDTNAQYPLEVTP